MMSNLISSIDIKSFRGINSFRLENLSQINILTGDNNCGKTSILEILESFGQPDDFRMWSSLIRKDFRESSLRGLTYYEGIYDLFDINSEKKRLEYTIVMDGISTNVALLAKEIEEEITEKEFYDLQGIYFPQENKDEGLLDNTQLVSKLTVRQSQEKKYMRDKDVWDCAQGAGRRNIIKTSYTFHPSAMQRVMSS